MNHTSGKRSGINRRQALAGATALGAAAAMPGSALASLFGGTLETARAGRVRQGTAPLARYLCEQAHGKIAERLDAVIADPAIDGERTALALMEARCPGCGERVHPATSRLSAVIPKWRSPAAAA